MFDCTVPHVKVIPIICKPINRFQRAIQEQDIRLEAKYLSLILKDFGVVGLSTIIIVAVGVSAPHQITCDPSLSPIMARLTLNGSSFTLYGWTVCLWSLVGVFQVLTSANNSPPC